MKPAEIFAPIKERQLLNGTKTTYTEIKNTTGISINRLRTLVKYPERATVAELESLTDNYKFTITIGGKHGPIEH